MLIGNYNVPLNTDLTFTAVRNAASWQQYLNGVPFQKPTPTSDTGLGHFLNSQWAYRPPAACRCCGSDAREVRAGVAGRVMERTTTFTTPRRRCSTRWTVICTLGTQEVAVRSARPARR